MTIRDVLSHMATALMLGCALFVSFAVWNQREVDAEESVSLPPGLENAVLLQINEGRDTFHVFTDYTCRFCREQEAILEAFVANSNRSVALVYHPFPLDTVRASTGMLALSLMRCLPNGDLHRAHRMLVDAFNLIGTLNTQTITDEIQPDHAREFSECLDSSETRRWILEARALGADIGVRSTPSIWYDGILMRGIRDVTYLDRLVENGADD